MEISIFEFKDYRRFLTELLTKNPKWRVGGRMRFAEAMDCKPGYMTQILNGKTNLSQEQAEKLSRYIGLSTAELHYFLLLVNFARSGTTELKNFYRTQIDQVVAQRVNLKDKIKSEEILSSVDQAIYYSSWHYAVVHMLCTIPTAAAREKMAARIGITPEKLSDILDFLEKTGLIERDKGKLLVTSKRVFMDKDSAFNYRHHTNFRQLATRKLDSLEKNDFHYSGVHSLSVQDSIAIIEHIRELILKSRSIIKDSPEEELFGFNIDFFRV